MSRKYKCEKCNKMFEKEECTDILFVKYTGYGSKVQTGKIRLCDDCVEKAQTILAEALDFPDWD